MSNFLTTYDRYKVIRPIIGDCDYDSNDLPIIRNDFNRAIDWSAFSVSGIQNINTKNDNSNTIALMYMDDKKLLPFWNNPLKKIPLLSSCAAVATPDFSCYNNMNANEIKHNVFMNRWLGVTWQNYGVKIIPTIGWGDSNTYSFCFDGVERGSVVTISTLGCQKHHEEFLKGFNEMKKRINPRLIIVYGKMIIGMTGRFLNFKYEDGFRRRYVQQHFPGMFGEFEIKEEK